MLLVGLVYVATTRRHGLVRLLALPAGALGVLGVLYGLAEHLQQNGWLLLSLWVVGGGVLAIVALVVARRSGTLSGTIMAMAAAAAVFAYVRLDDLPSEFVAMLPLRRHPHRRGVARPVVCGPRPRPASPGSRARTSGSAVTARAHCGDADGSMPPRGRWVRRTSTDVARRGGHDLAGDLGGQRLGEHRPVAEPPQVELQALRLDAPCDPGRTRSPRVDRSGCWVTGHIDVSSSVVKRTAVTWAGAGNTSTWSIGVAHGRAEHGEIRRRGLAAGSTSTAAAHERVRCRPCSTDEQVAAYHRDGFLVVAGFVDARRVRDAARSGRSSIVDGVRAERPSARCSPPTSRNGVSNREFLASGGGDVVLLRGGRVRPGRRAAPGQGAEHQQDRPRRCTTSTPSSSASATRPSSPRSPPTSASPTRSRCRACTSSSSRTSAARSAATRTPRSSTPTR